MTPTTTPAKGTATKAKLSPRALNNLRNGSRLVRLALGELPPKLSRVTRYSRLYRAQLEEAVCQSHGEVTLTQAHLVDSAAGWQQALGVLRWLMREKLAEMSVADIRECVKAMAAARDARNRAVMALDLDRPPPNPWDLVDVKGETTDG